MGWTIGIGLSIHPSHFCSARAFADKLFEGRGKFVYVLNQWETALQCNVVSHWLGAHIKWSLQGLISNMVDTSIMVLPSPDKLLVTLHWILSLLAGLWFIKQFPCVCRQTADQIELRYGGPTPYITPPTIPPQGLINFGHVLLNFNHFLASDWWNSFQTFAEKLLIWLRSNWGDQLIMDLCVLGPISLTILPTQLKCDGNFILLSSKY